MSANERGMNLLWVDNNEFSLTHRILVDLDAKQAVGEIDKQEDGFWSWRVYDHGKDCTQLPTWAWVRSEDAARQFVEMLWAEKKREVPNAD